MIPVVLIGVFLFLILHRMPGHFFDSNGCRVFFTDEGKGEPVILVHGLGANADLNWRRPGLTRLLSRKFRVIAFDLRGHGKTDQPEDASQYGIQMVEDITRLMDHLQIQKAHVAGYSLGGFLVLKFMMLHPDRVQSAALCAAGWKNPDDPSDIPNPYKPPVHRKSLAPQPAILAATGENPVFHWIRNEVGDRIQNKGALKALKKSFREFIVTREELEANTIPALCLIGTQDGLWSMAEDLTDHMASLKVVTIDNANHFTSPLYPKFKRELFGFLKEHPILQGAGMKSPIGKTSSTWKVLTPEEERVIVHKGTEAPFSGQYVSLKEDGTYVCKRCAAPLFKSQDKFDSHCGWPSFDAEIPGAVTQIPDKDGQRTEILCTACGAHLGHIFRGEGLTPKNARYCVNSISMDFQPGKNAREDAYFAGGCFWGVEYYFNKVKGVHVAESGYMGGSKEKPTYEQVCSHTTGHAETVHVAFDPSLVSYEDLAKLFFEIHDPTQKDRQGPDIGDQYRSAIFYTSDAQKQVTERLIQELKSKGLDVKTLVEPAGTFWKAEGYHQDYYEKKGGTPYCHIRTPRF